MPPTGPSWEELTWSWAFTTGHLASDQKLEAAAKAAWSYSLLCAWTYLNDHDAAHELMDHAVQNASRYVTRHPNSPSEKLIARIKSVIRRRAKQLAARRSRELPSRVDARYGATSGRSTGCRGTESMPTNCSPGYRLLRNRSSTGAGTDTPGERLLENWKWITRRSVVHTCGSWSPCSKVYPGLEILPNATELAPVLRC